MSKVSSLLDFEFIPDRLKDFVYSKYHVDSLSARVFGQVNKDYCLVLVAYNNDEALSHCSGSYRTVSESLNQNIFEKYLEISSGMICLPEGFKVFVEKYDESQVLGFLKTEGS